MFKVKHLPMCSQDVIIVSSVTAEQELEGQACTAAPMQRVNANDLFLLKENATSLNLPWLQPTEGSAQASLNLMLLLDEEVESVSHPELLNSHPHG